MDLTVLNYNLDAIAIIDTYKSLIWTDRYNEYGDFEIYTPIDDTILQYIKQGYYLRRRDSDHVMIIETLKVSSDVEEGNNLTVTGRSLESLLERRIIWGQKTLSGNLQNGIQTLLNENLISPSNESRKISTFAFEASTDPIITGLTIDAQYTGDNLYEVIQKICAERDIGFQVTLNDNKKFVFKLYAGVDRSYSQLSNPYVVFSPKFDNLISSNYIESKKTSKNVTLVGGEGEGSARRYTAVGDVAGISRRELFTDARDISSDVGDGVKLTDEEYIALLRQRGKEKLAENTEIISFEGQAEVNAMFKYGVDFFNGDIVQIANEYGHEARARIVEIVHSIDTEGVSVYPTFSTIEENKLDTNTILLLNGEDFVDKSMYNHTVVNNGVVSTSDKIKFGGKSLYFNGSTSYLRVNSSLFNFGQNNFTFDWWEYCDTGNSATRFALSINGGSGGICAGGGGNLNALYMGSAGSGWDIVNGQVVFSKTPGEWVHWAVVRSNDTMYVFRNGTLNWSAAISGSVYWNDTGLVIGSFLYDASHYFSGYIDEFRVSNVARWTSNFIPPSKPYEEIEQEGEIQV